MLPADVSHDLHHRVPLGQIVAMMLRHRGSQRHGAGGLFQCSQRNATETIFFVDDLALLRHPQVAVDGAGRRAEHCGMGLATTATDGAASAMKQVQFDAVFGHRVHQLHLRFLQRPSR